MSRTPTTSKTRKHSSKSPDKGAQEQEAQKPPEAAADSNAALPSSSPAVQDEPKPPAAEAVDSMKLCSGAERSVEFPLARSSNMTSWNESLYHTKCKGAFLATVVTSTVILMGSALVLVGIVLGTTLPDVQRSCPPPDKPLAEGTVLLATKGGRLVGRTVTVDGVALTRFLGVPFAQSTAGIRRFLVPLPMAPPQNPCEVREYLEPGPPCAQWSNGSVLGSEDCLHANVWTPATAIGDNGNGGGRALVVAVSGSWFEAGSNDDPDWPQLAAKGNVVVVAPNHRQGVLGFLHPSPVTGVVQDPAVDDVVFAVQWAIDNAKFFGADPKQLVLVGRGSGAYLLSMASSSMPNGTALRAFYHGIVYGSLLPLDPKDKNEPYRSLAWALRCNDTADKAANVSAWVPCFRAASVDDLVRAARGFSDFPLRFAPRVDITLLLMNPAARTSMVIAGLDMADLRDFFTQRILPLAQRDGNASTPEALLDYTLNVFNVPPIEKSLLKNRYKITNVEGLVRKLPCSTHRVAKAAVEGYHYLFDSAMSSGLLQPPMGISQLAQFVSLGTAPPLVDSSPWLPLSKLNKTRLISKDGHENFTNLDDECAV
ncbi:acetylcholinesterase [Dermacentor silvarum]|uniref:acetylcholinesterase n=1 Tax=Dermacentor silvarum TaxID=543639 RepID=UPI002100CDD6|nr:acetylcholinesterase [Dermacentor silvarum]